jgi:hypothetical protein
MTDQRLHDLLHETVSDVTGPDLVDTAWRSGVRARRRRTMSIVASVGAVVVAVTGAVALVDRGPSAPAVTTGPSGPPSSAPTPPPRGGPSTGSSTGGKPYLPAAAPDAHYAGLPVWWSPTLAQERGLPAYPHSPLPATIDVDAHTRPLAEHPIRRAVAAFAGSTERRGLEFVVVLSPGGQQLSVDTSPVRPMTDPEGNRRVRVGPSLLSRSGQYLLFPQDHSLLVYTLQTGQWRTIHTGQAPTWDATWVGNRRISLPDPARPFASAPEYSLDGTNIGSGNVISSGIPDVPLGESRIYGRARTGGHGVAQAFYAGAPIPQPGHDLAPAQSDWIAVTGVHSSILLIPSEAGRQKQCCQVDGWLAPGTVMYDSSSSTGTRLIAWDADTGRFFQVSQLTGVDLGRESVVASYAQVPAAGAPLPY